MVCLRVPSGFHGSKAKFADSCQLFINTKSKITRNMTPHLQSVCLCTFARLACMAVQQTKRDGAIALN